jgi:hypothetical protein
MTLEDQIRRMGEARAAEVHTPSWRDRSSHGGRGRWLLAAAAAIALVVVVGAIVVNRDDAPQTDVAGPDQTPLDRWIPASGVREIAYGASPGALLFTVPGQEVALVTTADDASSPADDDWTWISVGPQPLIFALSDGGDSVPRDGYFEFGTGDGNVLIVSERLSGDDLTGAETTLRAADGDIDAIATTIAGLSTDLEVVYAGPASRPPTQVSSEPDVDGEVVWWINEPDPLRYMATYRWVLRSDGNAVNELFAFSEAASMNQEFAAYPVDPGPRRAADGEWLEIIERLLGPDPQVSANGDPGNGEVGGLAEIGLDLASPPARPVPKADGSWTVQLAFEEPEMFRDGGAIELSIGLRVTLTFLFQPGVSYESIELDAPLTEFEARRYAELINAFMADPPPATTTTDSYPTIDPPQQTGICAANPVPSDDVLDVATHIAFDRSPLDLDQDGVDDEMLVYEADGNWRLIARLRAGWTNAIAIGTPPTPPALAQTSGGVPAGTDLDDDGGLEFFVTGYLGPSAKMLTLRGCELVDKFFLDEPAEGLGATFGVQIGLSPDMPLCQGRACATRVRCVDDVLTQELFVGTAANDDSGYWTTAELRLDPSGEITSTELPNRPVSPFETLDDPPTEATTGVIDCVP